MSSFRLVLFGLVLLVGGAAFAAVSFSTYREDERLDAKGQTVQGEVVGGRTTTRRRGGKTYKVDLVYGPTAAMPGRGTHRKEFTVSSAQYAEADRTGELPVAFLPDDLGVARVRPHRNNALPMGLGELACLAGAGMLGFLVYRLTRRATPAPAGGTYPPPGGSGYPPAGGYPPPGTYPPQGSHQPPPYPAGGAYPAAGTYPPAADNPFDAPAAPTPPTPTPGVPPVPGGLPPIPPAAGGFGAVPPPPYTLPPR